MAQIKISELNSTNLTPDATMFIVMNYGETKSMTFRTLKNYITKELNTTTGDVNNLKTDDKTSLVNAVNELTDDIGEISSILSTLVTVEESE